MRGYKEELETLDASPIALPLNSLQGHNPYSLIFAFYDHFADKYLLPNALQVTARTGRVLYPRCPPELLPLQVRNKVWVEITHDCNVLPRKTTKLPYIVMAWRGI